MPLRRGGAEEGEPEGPDPEGAERLTGGDDVDGALWSELAEPTCRGRWWRRGCWRRRCRSGRGGRRPPSLETVLSGDGGNASVVRVDFVWRGKEVLPPKEAMSH